MAMNRVNRKILLKSVKWLENIASAAKNRDRTILETSMRPDIYPRRISIFLALSQFIWFFGRTAKSQLETLSASHTSGTMELQQRLDYFAIAWLLRPNSSVKYAFEYFWCCVKGKRIIIKWPSSAICRMPLIYSTSDADSVYISWFRT